MKYSTAILISAALIFALPLQSLAEGKSKKDLKTTKVQTNKLDKAIIDVGNDVDNLVYSDQVAKPNQIEQDDSFSSLALLGDGGGDEPEESELGPASEDIFARLNTDFTISPHTTELLGESIDLSSGNVMFRNSDLSAPGNGLDIVVSRTLKGQANAYTMHNMFGDWTMDVPAIQTTLLRNSSRYSGSWGIGQECTGELDPGPISDWGNVFESHEYWNGDNLQLPGGVNDKLLDNHRSYLASSTTYRRVTQSNWKFSCFNRADGQGQGFIGYAPNGLKYTFDKLRLIQIAPILRDFKPTRRYNAFMLATKIEDRFGNYVRYNYSGNNLSSITSSDGRTITFSYTHSNAPNLITAMNYNGRVWRYEYTERYAKYSLTRVVRPDGRYWSYDLANLAFSQTPKMTYQPDPGAPGEESYECSIASGTEGFSASITHPDGITGAFRFESQIHGRSNVRQYVQDVRDANMIQSRCFANYALAQKTLSGSGVNQTKWFYSYSGNHGTWSTTSPSSRHLLPYSVPVDRENHKSTTVTAPDGSKTTYYYNRDFTSYKEGSLIVVDAFDTNGVTLLSRTSSTFVASPAIGSSDLKYENTASSNQRIMQSSSVVSHVDGSSNTYTTSTNTFDKFGYSQVTVESNNFNWKKRYTRNYYYHDATNWLIGLPTITQLSSNGSSYKEVSKTTYHSATGSYKSLPHYKYAYGRWYKRNQTYHTIGTSKGLPRFVSYNGTNRWVEYTNYKRGIAQTIRTPQSLSTSSQYAYKVVDNNGRVTRQTDFLGQCINYGYDNLGRKTLVDPCDSRWANTTVSYTTTSSTEGLTAVTAGMLKQTVTKGNYQRISYHDSLLRPIMSKEWDKTLYNTMRFTRQAFDTFNRPTYQSLPHASSYTPYGTFTTYDGLGRSKVVDDNTTSGSVNYSYLSNNRVQVNDNKGNVTTSTYLAYGSPEQNKVTTMASPHGVTTSMAYNIYGNMISVSQGGITEYRVYDNYQQLCKTTRPDIGNTAYNFNALGKPSWQASGSSVDGNVFYCDNTVNAADKATFSYDNLGNLRSTLFGDSSPDKTYTYDRNSRLTRLTAGIVSTLFEYNSNNLIEKETLNIDGQNLVLDYDYNNLGHLSSTRYPSGNTISYSPNALDQARQAGSYASNAGYFPNGMVKSHSYGNGFVHIATQKSSGMPNTYYDKRSTTYALNHGFSYDANNNLTTLDDKVINAYDLSLTYDGLDRLDKINDSYLGAGDVNYDTMGNITYYKLGPKTMGYGYSSNKQLLYAYGSESYSFSYDDKGNVTGNGSRTFNYNTANQMTQSGGYYYTYDGNNKRVKEVGSSGTSYSMYGSNGKLMYRKANNQHIDYYYLGSKLVANKIGGASTYLHADYLGSPAAESNTSGHVTNRMHYQPFGESIEAPNDDIGYTGHKFDTDLGLSYMQARYYDPVIGRFYSNDPVGFTGEVDTFNRYSYVANNPYKYTDPNGEEKITAQFSFGIAVPKLGFGFSVALSYDTVHKEISFDRSLSYKSGGAIKASGGFVVAESAANATGNSSSTKLEANLNYNAAANVGPAKFEIGDSANLLGVQFDENGATNTSGQSNASGGMGRGMEDTTLSDFTIGAGVDISAETKATRSTTVNIPQTIEKIKEIF